MMSVGSKASEALESFIIWSIPISAHLGRGHSGVCRFLHQLESPGFKASIIALREHRGCVQDYVTDSMQSPRSLVHYCASVSIL